MVELVLQIGNFYSITDSAQICLMDIKLIIIFDRLGTGTLTSVFVERVFQECLTYEGEMDYKTYLDFVLALENRHEPQSLQYLFKILDINSQGYLDTFSLNYFFRVSSFPPP